MTITEPRIIGERINPTGKKLFKEALLRGDMDYILNQALEQIGAGADILDVNVGLPGIDEKEMMISAVKSIQAIVDVPLQVDSTIPEVLDAALRVYNGKPIVNSVNGEEKSLKAVLPLVKKYGAALSVLHWMRTESRQRQKTVLRLHSVFRACAGNRYSKGKCLY